MHREKIFLQEKKLCGGIARVDERRAPTGRRVFVARTGLFTSVRPGNGSLLLNVNVSTSAFYPAERLQDWIDNRCQKKNNEQEWLQTMSEVVGLKVFF